jgi:hypothetical protein
MTAGELRKADRKVRIGFSGTRTGLTEEQYDAVESLLQLARSDAAVELHHGDCVGADEDVHQICGELDVTVVLHPPTNAKLRAICFGAVREEPPKPYQARNRAIVDGTEFLIAAPRERFEPRPARGQGTWSTIRYARDQGRAVYVVWPAGNVLVEQFQSWGAGTSVVRRVLGMLGMDARADDESPVSGGA